MAESLWAAFHMHFLNILFQMLSLDLNLEVWILERGCVDLSIQLQQHK